MSTTNQRELDVWLGDVVTIGPRKTRWTVTGVKRDILNLTSGGGATRYVERDRVRLVERCPDGPQLEMSQDGEGYLGGELVYCSDILAGSVVRWRPEPISPGLVYAQTVTFTVCCDNDRDGGRPLQIQTDGGQGGVAVLMRGDVLELARQLLRIAPQVDW